MILYILETRTYLSEVWDKEGDLTHSSTERWNELQAQLIENYKNVSYKNAEVCLFVCLFYCYAICLRDLLVNKQVLAAVNFWVLFKNHCTELTSQLRQLNMNHFCVVNWDTNSA